MKRILFLACIVLFVCKGHGQQLKGEIDAISFPEFKTTPTYSKSALLSRSPRYDEGYDLGYEQGHEDGLDDGENCDKYALSPGVVCINIDGVNINCDYDFLDGHRDGWYAGYEAAYQSIINQKAAACPANYVFDDFFCECYCVEQFYYLDSDNDGYYDWATQAKYQCEPPSDQWKTESEFFGIDCDDTNIKIHTMNVDDVQLLQVLLSGISITMVMVITVTRRSPAVSQLLVVLVIGRRSRTASIVMIRTLKRISSNPGITSVMKIATIA